MTDERPAFRNPRSPEAAFWRATALVLAAVMILSLAGVAIDAVWERRQARANCEHAPQHHPEATIGVPLERVMNVLADQWDVEHDDMRIVKHLAVDTVEVAGFDPGGERLHGPVRVQRRTGHYGRGWVLMEANVCD